MRIKEIIKKLEDRSGLKPLKFSDEGVISFIFNDEYTTNIEKSNDDQFLTIYGKIGDLPLENREACMLSLLDANLFGYRTTGASIGIDSDSEEIYLFRTFEAQQLDFEHFFGELKQFLHAQQDWTNQITDQAYLSYSK